jgi:hypothetical protein
MSMKYFSLSLALTVPMLCFSMACGGGTPESQTPEGAATPETPAAPEAPAAETPASPETPGEGAAPAEGTSGSESTTTPTEGGKTK